MLYLHERAENHNYFFFRKDTAFFYLQHYGTINVLARMLTSWNSVVGSFILLIECSQAEKIKCEEHNVKKEPWE